MDKYDGNYTYKKKHITIDKKNNPYPIIEQTINAELFPFCPNSAIDTSFFEKEEEI
ncbi:hypothetical protein [Oceanirhabdus seepicola]|uniref:Uncharacterized protein n=1 Tax=Oceanirhabdus seepicola TaxID=2828781 RepID=A0A9J6P294_9CLOT|nr:hypothetical protein [Oceanirhabdus seepicola]MCM1990177.1 hypothetical protein [Oceanirhabdus seepicola]